MKSFFHILIIAAAVLTAGCSTDKGNPVEASDLYGNARIKVKAQAGVDAQTRTTTVDLPQECIPNGGDFSLLISGAHTDQVGDTYSYNQSWGKVSAYDSPWMPRGTYAAQIAFGDPEAEGPQAACFAGEQAFEIMARRTVEIELTAMLSNAACRITFDQWFDNYYTDARITLRTESDNSFTFDRNDTKIIFVKSPTKLYIKGSATKTQTGTTIEFPETLIGTSAQRTLHTICLRAADAGAGKLVISLDDLFTEVEEQVIETNPLA